MLESIIAWCVTAAVLVALSLGLRYRRAGTLLALCSVALTLVTIEVALRLGYPPSWRPLRKIPSRDYHHVDRPGAAMYAGRVEGTDVLVRTNEDGFRTGHSRDEFLNYRDRIVVLGDSFVFGAHVRQEAAFPQVMEELLRARLGRDDLGILNAGTISYSPLIGQRVFEGVVAQYRPTFVVYVLDVTDIGDDDSYERELVGQGSLRHFDWEGIYVTPYYGAIYQLADNAEIPAVLARPLWPLLRRTGLGSVSTDEYDWYAFRANIGGQIEKNRYFIYRHPLEETRAYFDRTYGYIAALAESVRKAGAGFLLVVAPRFHHWNSKECPDNWEEDEYALDAPYQYEYFRYFKERRVGAPFEIFDLLPAFRQTHEFPLVLRSDPHWNDRGHAFVARILATRLQELGAVGG